MSRASSTPADCTSGGTLDGPSVTVGVVDPTPDQTVIVDPNAASRGKGERRVRLPAPAWTVPFLAILGIAGFFYVVSLWLEVVETASSDAPVTLRGVLEAFRQLDVEQARNTMGGLGEVMAAVLGLALTVSSIIVQLAATRFTPHVTSLFFRARANLLVLGFFVVSNIFVLWVNFSLDEAFLHGWGVLVSDGTQTMESSPWLLIFPGACLAITVWCCNTLGDRLRDQLDRRDNRERQPL